MEEIICTALKPITSVSFPPAVAPIIEPSPNSVMINPASEGGLCRYCVMYKLINGTAMLLLLLISITILNNHVSVLNPEKDSL